MLDLFRVFAGNLIEVMGGVLFFALVLRFVAYRTGKQNQVYFNTFSGSVEKILHGEAKDVNNERVDSWLNQILDKVVDKLPKRGLRSAIGKDEVKGTFRNQKNETFDEFAHGRRSIVHSVKGVVDAFKSPYPPNFNELTNRVLEHDKKWQTVFGFIPVNTLSRVLDILPGLFIVGGIFGTFIGITGALPVIAKIDLSNLEEATPILNSFVANVAFSMNTSIAGIIYSVILTILNTLFPLHTTRESVAKKLERCFQLMWSKIHGQETSTAETRIITLLEKINDNLEPQEEYKQAS